MAPTNKTGVMNAGTAALRKVLTNPLARKKRDEANEDLLAGHAALADDSINSIIEGEIIPRLLMAHSSGQQTDPDRRDIEIAPSDAKRFAALPLRLEAAGLMEEVDRFLEEGVSVDAIYLDLLAPAARKLGEMWETDECDFIDVTMGLWRLQEVMRDIASRSPSVTKAMSSPYSILVAPIPGDQHSFGALMLEEIFARAGWQSMAIPKPERRELLDVLARKSFDVVGLTVTRDCPVASLASLITAIRGVSANPQISVLIGGHTINKNPSIVTEAGADGTGVDARAALEIAERMVLASPVHADAQR